MTRIFEDTSSPVEHITTTVLDLDELMPPGSAGEAAGLRTGARVVETSIGPVLVGGDILIEVEGAAIESMAALNARGRGLEVGDEVKLVVFRESQLVTLRATIGHLTTAGG